MKSETIEELKSLPDGTEVFQEKEEEGEDSIYSFTKKSDGLHLLNYKFKCCVPWKEVAEDLEEKNCDFYTCADGNK